MEKNESNISHVSFDQKFEDMLELVARGRGIEILLRIADQTNEALDSSEHYEEMMKDDLLIPNLHPKKSIPKIFGESEIKERLELARDIADKLAHALYFHARKLIDKYESIYGLKTDLNKEPLLRWTMDAKGHLIEDDGRRIDKILDSPTTSNDNLIIEEYDLFVHNNYNEAAMEIFEHAWSMINDSKKSLSSKVKKLHVFRGLKRGKRIYLDEKNST